MKPFEDFEISLKTKVSVAVDKLLHNFRLGVELLNTVLRSETQVEVALPIRTILDIVAKTVALPTTSKLKGNVDLSTFISVNPKLQVLALSLLETLIDMYVKWMISFCLLILNLFYSCHSTLASESKFINKLFFYILDKTKGNVADDDHLRLRTKCYDVFSSWLTFVGGYSALTVQNVSVLLDAVIVDTRSELLTVCLQETSKRFKKRSKGKTIKFDASLGQSAEVGKQKETNVKLQLAKTALSTMDVLLTTCSNLIKEDTYKLIVSSFVDQLIEVNQHRGGRHGVYDCPQVRAALYAVVTSVILIPLYPTYRPLEPCRALFSNLASWESSRQARLTCMKASHTMRSLLCSIVPHTNVEMMDSLTQEEIDADNEVSPVKNSVDSDESNEMNISEEVINQSNGVIKPNLIETKDACVSPLVVNVSDKVTETERVMVAVKAISTVDIEIVEPTVSIGSASGGSSIDETPDAVSASGNGSIDKTPNVDAVSNISITEKVKNIFTQLEKESKTLKEKLTEAMANGTSNDKIEEKTNKIIDVVDLESSDEGSDSDNLEKVLEKASDNTLVISEKVAIDAVDKDKEENKSEADVSPKISSTPTKDTSKVVTNDEIVINNGEHNPAEDLRKKSPPSTPKKRMSSEENSQASQSDVEFTGIVTRARKRQMTPLKSDPSDITKGATESSKKRQRKGSVSVTAAPAIVPILKPLEEDENEENIPVDMQTMLDTFDP